MFLLSLYRPNIGPTIDYDIGVQITPVSCTLAYSNVIKDSAVILFN